MFTVPEKLSDFSAAGLADIRRIALTELNSLRESVSDPESVADADLARMEELNSFIVAVDGEVSARSDRAARFAGTAVLDPEPEPEPIEMAQASAPGGTLVTEATVDADSSPTARRAVQIADMAAVIPPSDQVVPSHGDTHYSIVAAADASASVPVGTELSMNDLGQLFESRVRNYKGNTRQQHSFALIRRELPAAQQLLGNEGEIATYQKFQEIIKASTAKANEVNAVVAANGWCAPSETIYSICNPVTSDGLYDLPEVQARRGGLRTNSGIDWATFFGGTYPALDTNVPGMTILTEAQVISDTAKTCLEIDCPSFTDNRLQVAALCLTSSLLQNRGYPEYVSEFTQGAMSAFAHFVNREVIDQVEDGSTAVSLAAVDPWLSDGSVVSQLLSAVEMAIVDMRYRLRLSRTAPMEVVLPEWIKAQMRADWLRRNGPMDPDMADARINSMFAARGARVQYVYDWQDAFSGVAGGVGALTAITSLPTSVKFLIYPPGTWILARQDVIRLDTVYDSVNLQQNLVTQLFMEDGWLPIKVCPLSRVYTVPICPNGATGAQREIDCVTP